MLIPRPIFENYQFVQQIEFKHKDTHRPDLGLDYVGFIQSSHVVARTMIEYDITFAHVQECNVLEYTLRPLAEHEILACLEVMVQSGTQYEQFIRAINNEPKLAMYHQELPEESNESTSESALHLTFA